MTYEIWHTDSLLKDFSRSYAYKSENYRNVYRQYKSDNYIETFLGNTNQRIIKTFSVYINHIIIETFSNNINPIIIEISFIFFVIFFFFVIHFFLSWFFLMSNQNIFLLENGDFRGTKLSYFFDGFFMRICTVIF